MSKPKTDLNPVRALRVKTIIEREGINQTEFAARVHLTQQAVSRIVNMKTALVEGTARDIVKAFPDYSLLWLLGLSDDMTEADEFYSHYARINKIHDDNVYTVRHLAKLHGVEVVPYRTGFIHSNGVVEDDFIVRIGDKESIVTYSDLTDLIADLAALTESRLSRIIAKAQ